MSLPNPVELDESSPYVVRALSADEHPLWRQLLKVSPQATLFHSPEWYEAIGVPFQPYGCFRGNELRAGVSLSLVGPKAAGHAEATLTAYQGVLLPPPADKLVSTLSTNKEITAAIAAFLQREFATVSLRLPPEVVDLQPFIWRGFQAGVRYTYRLPLTSVSAVLDGMDKRRRADLRAAEKAGVVVSSEAPFATLLALAERSFERQGKAAGFLSAATRAQASLAAIGRCRTFVASDQDGRALGGVWIAWDDRRAYYLIGGYDALADSASATSLALWKAIEFAATELALPEFDFEGSMVPAIERFFRKFGGTLTPTYTVAWTRPDGRARRSAKRIVRWIRGD